MVMRVPALQYFATATGESLVTWEHTARMMNGAPGRYSTALGRGIRQADMTAEWLLSTYVAGAIGDPKNAAAKVPLYGDMRLFRKRFETRETEYDGNALLMNTAERTVIMNMQYDAEEERVGETFFDALLNEVKTNALFWNDEHHKRLHSGFKAELHLGGHAFAKTSLLCKREASKETWIHCTYAPVFQKVDGAELTTMAASEPKSPLERIVLITGQQLTLLAMLLKDQEQAAPSLPLDDAADADASPTNENGALPGAPRTRIQDHNSIPGGDTPEPKRESENSQAQSSSDPGPPTHFMRTNPHEHSDSHPAFALVA